VKNCKAACRSAGCRTGRPSGLVPAGGSMAEMIDRHKLGAVIPLQETQLADTLPNVLENVRRKQYCINPEAQQALAKETLMQPVLERIGQLLGHP